MSTLKTGDKVATSDGKELGRVKEIGDTCFKVNAPRRRDFWLSQAAVERRVGKIALLRLDHEHLDKAQIEAAAHTGAHSHSSRSRSSFGFAAGLLFLGTTVPIVLQDRERRDKVKAKGGEAAAKVRTAFSRLAETTHHSSKFGNRGYDRSGIGASQIPDLQTLDQTGDVGPDAPQRGGA